MIINGKNYEITDLVARSQIRWSDIMLVKADTGGTELDDDVKIAISGVSADDKSSKSMVTFTRRELNAIVRTLGNLP